MKTASEVIDAYAALPQKEQHEAARAIRALPTPEGPVVAKLWLIVVGSFAIVLVGGLFLVYLLVQDGKSTEVVAPIVTAAIGVLAGLLAPSPIGGNS